MFIGDLISSFEAYGDAPAYLTQDRQIVSFGRMAEIVLSMACRMRAEGVRPGERVLPIVDNTALNFFLRLAVLWNGGVAVSVQSLEKLSEVGAAPDHVVAFSDQTLDGPGQLFFSNDWLHEKSENWTGPTEGGRLLVSSSGSSGQAKYMYVNLEEIRRQTDVVEEYAKPVNGACLITPSINARIANITMLKCLKVGQGVMGPIGGFAKTLRAAADFGVRDMMATPLSLTGIIRTLKETGMELDLKRLAIGGAVASGELLNSARRCFPNAEILITCGSTETGRLFQGKFDPNTHVEGWSGRILDHWEYRLRDEVGENIGPVGKGVLSVRVPRDRRAEGYLGGAPAYDQEGWFNTGDLVEVTEDRQVVYVGRFGSVINLGGSKYSPELIEMVISGCPGVHKCAVTTLTRGGLTELGVLVVASEDFDEGLLKSRLASRLSISSGVHIRTIDGLPVLPSGKLDRQSLSSQFT